MVREFGALLPTLIREVMTVNAILHHDIEPQIERQFVRCIQSRKVGFIRVGNEKGFLQVNAYKKNCQTEVKSYLLNISVLSKVSHSVFSFTQGIFSITLFCVKWNRLSTHIKIKLHLNTPITGLR